MRVARVLTPLSLTLLLAVKACGDGEEGTATPRPDAGTDVVVPDASLGPSPWGERTAVTETVALDGLAGEVSAVRDQYGMVHIYARTPEDALRVQGYMVAVDRGGQLELARRLATGQIAEIFGLADPGQINGDITMRTIGLHRAAKAMVDALPADGEVRRMLEAFAAGVTAFNRALRDGKVELAQPLNGMNASHFGDWTPADSLAMARLQSFSLSYDANADISLTGRVASLRAHFDPSASNPLIQKRAGLLRDLFRFAPPEPNTPAVGFSDEPSPNAYILGPFQGTNPRARRRGTPSTGLEFSQALLESTRPFTDAVTRAQDFVGGDEFAGSNNWAVAGSKTASGNAIMANDPHLGLSSPMVFWPTHLVVDNPDDPKDDMEVIGLAFPGIPGVILGSNRHVSWGATTAGYDVSDVWREKITGDGQGVVFKGQPVALQKVKETIKIAGSPDYSWDVLVVPHHGPIVPTIQNRQVVPPAAGGEALSVRWTGHAASEDVEAVMGLLRAKNVDDARQSLARFGVGAQNWMLADSAGDIAWTAPAVLPYRDERAYADWDPDTFTGTLPCFVLDGESGEHEWKGVLEERYLPKLKTPAKGWIATANTDNVAFTVDNHPGNDKLPNGESFYAGCEFAQGYRLARIEERLSAEAEGITATGMAAIQADHKSALGSRLTQYFVAALERAEAERLTPGTHPELAAVVADSRYDAPAVTAVLADLAAWQAGGFQASAGINLDDDSLDVPAAEADAARATVIFNAWLVRAVARTFEDELDQIGLKNVGTTFTLRAFVRLLAEPQSQLATYDAVTGESALWDDISTESTVESRDDRLVTALLDALTDLHGIFGADRSTWRWGELHRVRFNSLNPVWLVSVPPVTDPVFPKGFPRHGDQWNVDASNFSITRALGDPLSFGYGSGPVQRVVAEMTPSGPKIRNALPGGAVLAQDSPYFRDQAELWRKNENHPVPFEVDEVEASAKAAPLVQHIRFVPGG